MEVYALVGPSGTGKSHRAAPLAHQLGAEVIIDDGLIIKGNRIVTGVSAKNQPTRIGAIKTALFMDREQMIKAREVIAKLNPGKILILATSKGMAEKIVARLNLSPIKEFITIEQIASEKEIRKAKIMRRQHSKHVIPAPTVEVKKSFPETFIDPLQVFLRRKGHKEHKSWLEQSVVRPTFTMYGKLSISKGALKAIAHYVASKMPGVAGVKRSVILRNDQGVAIELEIIVGTKYNINDISRDMQAAVKEQVEKMTGLTVNNINVLIAGIQTEEIV